MSRKPETIFRDRVVKDLKTLPSIHIFSIQQTSIRGTPDLLCCYKGAFIAIELKSYETEAKGLQAYNLKKVEESGGLSYLVHPENWSGIFKILKDVA